MSSRKGSGIEMLSPSDDYRAKLQDEFHRKTLIMAKWAHELKNIFLAISSLVQNQNDILNPEYQESNFKMTHVTSQQSSKFLSSLCNFGMFLIFDITTLNSNPTQIKEKQTNTEFNIIEAMDFCLAMFQSKQRFDPLKKNIAIKSEYNIPIDKSMKTIDENRFKQVVINLLSNSYKFTWIGEICLSCFYISEGVIRIQVSDTGVGMSPQDQKQLFTPYYIVESNKEMNAYGSGLGLCIVQEIVNTFGSEINVRSIKGEGTAFWFDLKESIETKEESLEQNIIDPTSYISDSLKTMIMDINAGKKDDINISNISNGDIKISRDSKRNEMHNRVPIVEKIIPSTMMLTRLLSMTNQSLEEKKDNINNESFTQKSIVKHSSKQIQFNVESKRQLEIRHESKKNIRIHKEIHDQGGDFGRALSQYPISYKNQLFSKKTKKYNIFICDDDVSITAVSTKNLITRFFKTETTYSILPELYIWPNGMECLYNAYQFLLDDNPVNIILMDQNMPFLNGTEVCNILKNMVEMNGIKIYIVTSEEKEAKKKSMADGYFSKPITNNHIKEILKSILL